MPHKVFPAGTTGASASMSAAVARAQLKHKRKNKRQQQEQQHAKRSPSSPLWKLLLLQGQVLGCAVGPVVVSTAAGTTVPADQDDNQADALAWASPAALPPVSSQLSSLHHRVSGLRGLQHVHRTFVDRGWTSPPMPTFSMTNGIAGQFQVLAHCKVERTSSVPFRPVSSRRPAPTGSGAPVKTRQPGRPRATRRGNLLHSNCLASVVLSANNWFARFMSPPPP